jgi:hypothetical protein
MTSRAANDATEEGRWLSTILGQAVAGASLSLSVFLDLKRAKV